jgi:hypothetical protein
VSIVTVFELQEMEFKHSLRRYRYISMSPTAATIEPTAMPAITPGEREELLVFCDAEEPPVLVLGPGLVLVVGAPALFDVTAAFVVATLAVVGVDVATACCAAVTSNVETKESCPWP